jgi:hypothetical protein
MAAAQTCGGPLSFCASISFRYPNQTFPARRPAAIRPALSFHASARLQSTVVSWYFSTMVEHEKHVIVVERVQTGVRVEKRLLKVLKALGELKDMSLGDLLEGIVLHAFEGKAPFSPETLKDIDKLRSIYGLTLKAADSHQLKERHK